MHDKASVVPPPTEVTGLGAVLGLVGGLTR